ncbi:MAG: hypothetical protein P8L71_09630 [Flavobacteriales bacterium]|nr:hypothetical protein [Flavobacteriales bacterium]
MMHEMFIVGITMLAFVLLFGLGEFLHHYKRVGAESTRRLVHAGSGVMALSFPLLFKSHWSVLVLSLGFFILLLISQRWKYLMRSINGVKRKTAGSLLFPMVIYGCFALAQLKGNDLFFYLPILILSIADPTASWLGMKLKWGKYSVFGNDKTIIGSTGFIVVSFVITVLLLVFQPGISREEILIIAGLVAIGSCISEALANKGFDNLLIPATVVVVLESTTRFL